MARYYVKFFENERECCGSDSIFILDGRNKLPTMIEDAKLQKWKLRYVKPFYNRFQIIKSGNRLFENTKVLYDSEVMK